MLTKPSEPAVPGGHDNINDNLIVSVDDEFVSSLGTRSVSFFRTPNPRPLLIFRSTAHQITDM